LDDRTGELTEGTVYRRIPNYPTYFDPDSGRPERAAFEPRAQDKNGLSVDLVRDVAEQALKQPRHEGFGLCSLNIADIVRVTNGVARIKKPPPGQSHVRIENCSSEEVQLALAEIAKIEIPLRGVVPLAVELG
jgi:hypothetical protein